MDKIYISADELLIDSFKLAKKIYKSGFQPQFIVGVWRGGAPVGIAVQEYLDWYEYDYATGKDSQGRAGSFLVYSSTVTS